MLSSASNFFCRDSNLKCKCKGGVSGSWIYRAALTLSAESGRRALRGPEVVWNGQLATWPSTMKRGLQGYNGVEGRHERFAEAPRHPGGEKTLGVDPKAVGNGALASYAPFSPSQRRAKWCHKEGPSTAKRFSITLPWEFFLFWTPEILGNIENYRFVSVMTIHDSCSRSVDSKCKSV